MHLGLTPKNVAFLGSFGVHLHLITGTITGFATFSFLGANQTWTVPANVTTATARLWGAGGGGSPSIQATGAGTGGYSLMTFGVTPGQTATIVVGGATGTYNLGGSQVYGPYGGGGPGAIVPVNSNNAGFSGSHGGGRSEVVYPGVILVAGGGGGAGIFNSVDTIYRGGNAGASGTRGTGLSAINGGLGAGTGGGGVDGYSVDTNPFYSGSLRQGSTGLSSSDDDGAVYMAAGGGGGGYYGGGAGFANALGTIGVGGGGGGSSFASGGSAITFTGHNTSDSYWNGVAGLPGQHGYIAIFYSGSLLS